MTSLTAFTVFMSLPVELRLKIWKYLLPDPRILPIHYNRRSFQYTSDSAPPVLLHICPESRDFFLETYSLLTLSPRHPSTIYVDFLRDTLFFHNLDCSPNGDLSHDLATSPDSDKILHVAVDSEVWEVLRAFKWDGLSEVGLLRNLKSVALVMPRRGHGASGDELADAAGNKMFWTVEDVDRWRDGIRHVGWYVEQLRADVEAKVDWGNGKPQVTMWLR